MFQGFGTIAGAKVELRIGKARSAARPTRIGFLLAKFPYSSFRESARAGEVETKCFDFGETVRIGGGSYSHQ